MGNPLFMGENVYQAAERIANVKAAPSPGLACRVVFHDKPGSMNTTLCSVREIGWIIESSE
jgi:hypothetical protein